MVLCIFGGKIADVHLFGAGPQLAAGRGRFLFDLARIAEKKMYAANIPRRTDYLISIHLIF